MYKTPWVFLYGHPRPDGQGIVLILENAYWVHCAAHPCWYNPQPAYVSEESQPYSEILPKLFASQRDEFREKFPQAERSYHTDVNLAQPQPQEKLLIAHPDLSLSPSLTGIVSPSARPDASPEQVSTTFDMPTHSASPERESVKNDNDRSWRKRVRRWTSWRWKRLWGKTDRT
jgi:hypothetical protein